MISRPSVAEDIAKYVSGGASFVVAAQSAGVSESSLQSWLARGRAALESTTVETDDTPELDRVKVSDRPFAAFALLIDEATATAEITAGAMLFEIAKGGQVVERRTFPDGSESEKMAAPDAKPIMYWLTHRRPERWAPPPKRIEMSGPDSGPVVVREDKLEAAIAQFMEAAAKQA